MGEKGPVRATPMPAQQLLFYLLISKLPAYCQRIMANPSEGNRVGQVFAGRHNLSGTTARLRNVVPSSLINGHFAADIVVLLNRCTPKNTAQILRDA